jgi:diguanylate cyclase (GGDEF)-like protein
MRNRKTLKSRLILSIFLGCLIPYLLGGLYLKNVIEEWVYTNHHMSTSVILRQVSLLFDEALINDMREMAEMMATDERLLDPALKLTHYENFGSQDFVYAPEKEELAISSYFQSIKDANKKVNFLFYGTTDGGYIEYPQFEPSDSYDPRTRNWYIESIDTSSPVISSPYVSLFSNQMVIGFTKQVSKNGEVLGVVGATVDIQSMLENTGNIQIGSSGYIILLTDNNTVLVSPEHPEWLMQDASTLDINQAIDNNTTLNFMTVDGEKKVVDSYRSEQSGWQVLSVVDESVLLEKSREVTNILLWIYTLTLGILFFIVYTAAKRVTDPIFGIADVISSIGRFDFGELQAQSLFEYQKRPDEIGVIARSIGDMKRDVERYMDQLKRSNREIMNKNHLLQSTEESLKSRLEEIDAQNAYIQFLADHDALTNLPNRRKFIETLAETLNAGESGAILMLDLDNFKGINDTQGHFIGDQLLKLIAEDFQHIAGENVFVSRFGGDEFLILIKRKHPEAVEHFIESTIRQFREAKAVENMHLTVNFSMGVTLFPEDSTDVEQLIMNADLAMYSVKNSGKNSYIYFDEVMKAKLKERADVELMLREAIENKAFKMLYQPIVETKTGKAAGFEALIRLTEGSLSPGIFIPIAEETGLIVDIGRQAVQMVIEQLGKWIKAGEEVRPVSVNFSALQLYDPGFLEFLESTLKKHHVPATFLEIEITENIFLENQNATLTFLSRLRELGIRLAIDDFGTGYSSINYLSYLPVDHVKLDKTLCERFLDIENIRVMDSIIMLAHGLKLEVVAEGIEYYEQVRRLKVGGCDYIQGFYFSMPLEAEAVPEAVRKVYQ